MISSTKYKKIADYVGNSQSLGSFALANISQMREDISNSEINENSIDRQKIYDQINATYDVVYLRHSVYTESIIDFVKFLQIHVEKYYGDVNSFLSDNNIKVLPAFADISDFVGFYIYSSNIENIS